MVVVSGVPCFISLRISAMGILGVIFGLGVILGIAFDIAFAGTFGGTSGIVVGGACGVALDSTGGGPTGGGSTSGGPTGGGASTTSLRAAVGSHSTMFSDLKATFVVRSSGSSSLTSPS